MEILAPVSGEAVPLSEVPDEVFAEGMAEEGGAIVPAASGEAVAPVSGTLAKLCSEWSRLRNGLDGYVILLGNRKPTNLARKPFTFLN